MSTSLLERWNQLDLPTRIRTPTGKLVLVALASCGLSCFTILTLQASKRKVKRKRLRGEVEDKVGEEEKDHHEDEMVDWTSNPSLQGKGKGKESGATTRKGKKATNDMIVRESLARNYVFFGEEGMQSIRNSFVVVVGLGGVGSAAATMLVRSGVGKVRLIDFDQVTLSSLNRHACATLADVGIPKVTCCASYFESIAPWVEVDPRIELFGKDVAEGLLDGKPDFVLDCIDNLETKVDLLEYCHKNKIPVFSSLGAASKSDPSMIQISDISCTFEDPLARSVRRSLKLRGVNSGIPVVYSTEKPRSEIALLPLPDEEFAKGKVDELHPMANFRVRILPVLGPLPAMFGNAAATYVLQKLGKFPLETLPVKNRKKTAGVIYRQLSVVSEKMTGTNQMAVSEEDVLYIVEEIHRMRSVVPPHAPPARAVLMPWRKNGGFGVDNLVLFEKVDGLKHEEHCLKGNEDPEAFWGRDVTAHVAKRFAEEKRVRKWRSC